MILKIKELGALMALGLIVFSGCGKSSTENSNAPTPESTAPALQPYEVPADEEEALTALSDTQFKAYYDIICHNASFRDFLEIQKSLTESPDEKEAQYAYVNDAPDVVRAISNRNKTRVSSNTSVEKPTPARCDENTTSTSNG